MASNYNGYTNWATWNVALWVDNEEKVYRLKERIVGREGADLRSSLVKTLVLRVYPNGTPDMNGVSGLDEVNWKELTDEWRQEPDSGDEDQLVRV